jgi:hypothetical protein
MHALGIKTYSSLAPEIIGNFERNVPFSVECWFYQTSMKACGLVNHMGPSPLLRGWLLQTWTGRNIGLSLCSDNGANNFINCRTASGIFAFNTWVHIIFTYNGSSLASGIKGYVNGAVKTLSVVGDNLTATIQNSEKLRIGTSYGAGNLPGRIDEVIIYPRVLTASEVAQRYAAGAGTETLFGPAYLQYHLNEATGIAVSDSSGNMRHGQTVNSPAWIAGKLNNCLQLDGSTQSIEV